MLNRVKAHYDKIDIQQLQHTQLFNAHHTGQPALSGTFSQELEDFAGAKFYFQHATADGN